jgi:serine/threonine protein kinase
MSPAPRICPVCTRPPPGGEETCAEHGLYAVEPSAAARIDRAPLIGRLIAERYLLLDLLGDGGMGTVYRGRDRRLDREVAVKVLGGMAALGEDDRLRFEREAQALSRLHSEHTVTVYDYGVATQPALVGLAYIVLELVRGPDLFSRIYDGPVSPREAASVTADIARSLEEAHRQGIIHRDIKPSNVLLTTTPDGRNIAKLIDFGVARMDDGRKTRTGVMMGTPHYMAPEQCTGGRSPVDARTDLYALGVMLYEMLAGQPPFDGEQPMHILFKQVNSPVPPLPGPPRSRLRRRLEAAIQTAMAKDINDRFASVQLFAIEVSAAVAENAAEADVPLVAELSRPPEAGIGARADARAVRGAVDQSVWRRAAAASLARGGGGAQRRGAVWHARRDGAARACPGGGGGRG